MRTIIGVCLDESGSMDEGNKRDAAISSFNEFLHEQQRLTTDECLMAIARFNVVSRISDKMQPVKEIKDLTRETYMPGGGTALLDAIAYVVREVEGGVQPEDRVVIVILTDGEENSSHETTLAQVKELIESKEKLGNWSFVYLSAGLNAFAQGAAMGVRASNVGQMVNSAAGYSHGTRAVSSNMAAYRASSMKQAVGMSAGVNLDEDDPAVQGAGTAQPMPSMPGPSLPHTGHPGPVKRAMTPQGPPTIPPPVTPRRRSRSPAIGIMWK